MNDFDQMRKAMYRLESLHKNMLAPNAELVDILRQFMLAVYGKLNDIAPESHYVAELTDAQKHDNESRN